MNNKNNSEDIRNSLKKLKIQSKVIEYYKYDLILNAVNIKKDMLVAIYENITEGNIIDRIIENVNDVIGLVKKDVYEHYSQQNQMEKEKVLLLRGNLGDSHWTIPEVLCLFLFLILYNAEFKFNRTAIFILAHSTIDKIDDDDE